MTEDSQRRGRFFGAVQRRPKAAFWTTLAVGLLVGAGIGAAGNDRSGKVKTLKDRNGALAADLATARSARAALSHDNDQLQARVTKLTARAEVPDFTGRDAGDVEIDDTVTELRWNVKTVKRVSTVEPGTVVAQRPAAGVTLKAGRAITLTVARKAPPKPRQWVTIKTLRGASSTKSEEFTIPDGADARLQYSMPEDSNNSITLYRRPDEYVDLMLNEIGPQYGSTRIYDSGTFYLEVDGSYTIQVQVFKRPG